MNREMAFMMRGFTDEIQKEAAILPAVGEAVRKVPHIGPHAVKWVQRNLENKFGRQLLLGAGTGAGTGYLAADDDHKLRGALIGAGIGTGISAGRIALSPAARQEMAQQARSTGKRLRYQLTGTGLADDPAKRLQEAHELKILEHPEVLKPLPSDASALDLIAHERMLQGKGWKDSWFGQQLGKVPGIGPKIMEGPTVREAAEAAYKRELDAFNRGEMHAPGIFASMATHPIDFFKNQWQRNPLMMKGFTGYGVYGAGKALAEKPEPGSNQGRFERALNLTGQTAGWLASPQGFFPGLAVAPALGRAGGALGRGLDKAFHTGAPVAPQGPHLEPPGGA